MKKIALMITTMILVFSICSLNFAFAGEIPGTSKDNPDILIEPDENVRGDNRPTADWDLALHNYYGAGHFLDYVYTNYNYKNAETMYLNFSAECEDPTNLYIKLYEKGTNRLIQANYYYNITNLDATITYSNLNHLQLYYILFDKTNGEPQMDLYFSITN